MAGIRITLDPASKRNLCGGGCAQCCCPGTIIEDHFNGNNGDHINARLPDTQHVNSRWSAALGGAAIDSNQLAFQPNASGMTPIIGAFAPGTTDHPVTVSADLILGESEDNNSMALVGRVANGNLWMGAIIGKYATGDPPRLQIIELSAAGLVGTVRAETLHGFTQNTTYAASMTFNGNDISFTADGVTVNYTSTLYNTQSEYGLYSTNDVTISVNKAGNFKVACT